MKITKEDIKKYLPHREPFLFVDEVVNIDEENGIHAKKLVSELARQHMPRHIYHCIIYDMDRSDT